MLHTKKLLLAFIAACTIFIIYACVSKKVPATTPAASAAAPVVAKTPRVLVFTRTKGFYHTSIPSGMAAIQRLGREHNFLVDTTAEARYFVEDSLKHYDAVIFMSTTHNVLNGDQQVAFERYIQAGGGFAGVHAAADTEYDWPWYNKLVGAYFLSHPKQQKAIVQVTDRANPASAFLPEKWERFDEWYNYKDINPDIKVLALLDESSYQGGQNGDKHPIAWYHDFDGGRSFYTGMGHTNESYTDSLFLRHLLEGIRYAIGSNPSRDYSKAYAVRAPEDNRFTKTVLSNDLNEPMELAVAPDGRVFFTERGGNLYLYDPIAKKTKLIRKFPAKAVDKYLNGLIGITLDPDFATNQFIYFFYSSSTGEQYHQNISRFLVQRDGYLDTLSEKIIIKVPIDLEVSAHTGGSLAWDKNKNLFISTGDNTVPFESQGYAPMDERPGRQVYDAQRSAANPNDLRGKILRIHPEADGSYTIPEGNLFAKGTAGTRPEIYVMGCRNPYRIAVDTATSILYWGEVGPDAGNDATHGPRGYDEFNQARKAGNFGWPFFVGDSKPYNDSDFATKAIGALFDVNGPTNNSPNNTGMKLLPPPTKPMVWYPYARSTEFPDLGEGGRCAMGGPMYHFNASLNNPGRLPAYFDKSLFVYDWMRNWVFAIRFDEQNNYKRMEKFMGSNGDFRRPVDMEFGPDGTLYLLEYGSVYGIDNDDARLVRIDYNAGNRVPVAQITTNDTIGLAPFKVAFKSTRSYDYDEEDKLTFKWQFADNSSTSSEPNPTYTYTKNGVYKAVLTVSDQHGQQSTDTLEIKVGNTLPQVAISTTGNSSFFFPKRTALPYRVAVTDKEDPAIDKKAIAVSLNYIAKVANNEALVGHQQINENYNLGRNLIAASDCKACHQVDAKSVGPSFMAVSMRYKNDKKAVGYLVNKVITGGGGVWGEHAMSAHPQLSKEDATEIVKYVLSVSDKKEASKLPQQGSVVLDKHLEAPDDGRYLLSASYTDKGGAIVPLTNKTTLMLRPAKIAAADADIIRGANRQGRRVGTINNGSYLVFKNIDLVTVDSLVVNYSSRNLDGRMEVRLDSATGQSIAAMDLVNTGAWNKYVDLSTPIADPGGKHDLYFVFVKEAQPNKNLATISWVRFVGGREVAAPKQGSKVAVDKPVVAPAQKSPPAAAKQASGDVSAGAALFSSGDCRACHAPEQKLVGPALMDIAKKYDRKPATAAMLADKIIQGGSGNWGPVPMVPHPQLSKKEAMQLVAYIMSLKK